MSTDSQDRKDFLIAMYGQLCNEINRSIQLIWQAVGILISAFALLSLVEKSIIPLDIAVSLIILISVWLVAHILNSNYWYNRNLAIIANIEKQFLYETDQKDIHYYFGRHRSTKSILSDLKIQLALVLGLVGIILIYHFSESIIPMINKTKDFNITMLIPYVVLISSICFVFGFKNELAKKYDEFKTNSPGKSLNTENIEFGKGHPVD